MKNISRREFLNSAGVAAATLATGAWPRFAAASPAWGDPLGEAPTSPAQSILEIHLLGGVAPFESFYFRPPLGLRTRGFDSEIGGLIWNGVCANTPSGIELDVPFFANDSKGKEIRLGPFAKPLWRPDIRDRMRILVLSHNLLPHEAAIPLALTGLRLGNPNQANLGAAIAHRYTALDLEAGTPRTLPYAYGLVPQSAGLNSLLATSMGALGRHPGAARPLVLKIGAGFGTFINQLQRSNMTAAKDALLNQYRGQYRDWLRWMASGPPTRSNAFRDYDTSVSALVNAASLSSFLGGAPTVIPSDQECAREPSEVFDTRENPTKTALQAAVFLLTRPPAERARYVCVIDSGIEPRVGLPYDCHNSGHPGDTGSNLWNVFQTLGDLINTPTSSDPNKLNLNDTLIIINTEFGRTPFKSLGNMPVPSSVGRDHWPQAYVNVLIGGPITSRAVVGSISDAADEGGIAEIGFSYSPTDVHAAALVAMGINPFESESYALGQLSDPFGSSLTHQEGMELLRTDLLGVS